MDLGMLINISCKLHYVMVSQNKRYSTLLLYLPSSLHATIQYSSNQHEYLYQSNMLSPFLSDILSRYKLILLLSILHSCPFLI